MEIESKALTTCTISPDGNEIVMGFIDAAGQPSTIKMPVDQVGALAMTLPNLLERALRIRFADNSLRYAFPLGSWICERSSEPGVNIMTFAIPDGFNVSFSLRQEVQAELSRALDTDRSAKALALLN